jgi:outer membrane scaffolding protein for murein synthesis (MipA/OmpV family)
MSSSLVLRAAWAASLLVPTLLCAQEIDNQATAPRYLVGLRLSDGPVYFGQRERGQEVRPVLALHWKSLRISNSGGGSLLGERASGGATTDLLDDEEWRLSVGLRLDRGRNLSGVARLAELPDVRATVRGRSALTWHQTPTRDWTVALNGDLLGRGGGLIAQLSYTERLQRWDALSPIGGEWTAYASLSAGNGKYMNSHFGVPAGLTSFSYYRAGAGLRNANLGLGWQRHIDSHWMIFGGASLGHLLGPAADAPFIEERRSWGMDFGVAYRR